MSFCRINSSSQENSSDKQVGVIIEAADIINRIIHSEIENMDSEQSIHNPAEFSLDSLISKTDPTLQLFLETATRTIRER